MEFVGGLDPCWLSLEKAKSQQFGFQLDFHLETLWGEFTKCWSPFSFQLDQL